MKIYSVLLVNKQNRQSHSCWISKNKPVLLVMRWLLFILFNLCDSLCEAPGICRCWLFGAFDELVAVIGRMELCWSVYLAGNERQWVCINTNPPNRAILHHVDGRPHQSQGGYVHGLSTRKNYFMMRFIAKQIYLECAMAHSRYICFSVNHKN